MQSIMRYIHIGVFMFATAGLSGCGDDDGTPVDSDFTLGDEGRLKFFVETAACLAERCPLIAMPLAWDEEADYYVSIQLHPEAGPIPSDWTFESSDENVFVVQGVTCGEIVDCPSPLNECLIEDVGCAGSRTQVNVGLRPVSKGEASLVVRDDTGTVVDRAQLPVW